MLTPEQIRLAEEAAEELNHVPNLREWLDQSTVTIGEYERRERAEQDAIDQARHEERY